MSGDLPMLFPIPSCPGYSASIDGRIWSVETKWRGFDVREMTPTQLTSKPYLKIRPVIGGRRVERLAHRLVAEAIHGPCPDGMECRHLDGDPTNNAAWNLAWGTHRENCQDRITHGTQVRGAACISNSKLTEAQVREVRRRAQSGEHRRSIAADFDISPNYVNSIARGETWKHVA